MAEEPNEAGGINEVGEASASGAIAVPRSHAAGTDVAAAVDRLRAEIATATESTRKARLLYEVGEIHEREGDSRRAEQDYVDASAADPDFREALEARVRLAARCGNGEARPALVSELIAAASTPEEKTRALLERAAVLESVEDDLERALEVVCEATETGAAPADLGAAWLLLERLAARTGSTSLRERALAARAENASDSDWRGLLLVDLAELAERRADAERASELAGRALHTGGLATWAATSVLERVSRHEGESSETERTRARVHAQAMEARAELLHQAMNDPDRGSASGVPSHACSIEHIADSLLRAADAHKRSGDAEAAATALDRALALVTDAPSPRAEGDESSATAPESGRDAAADVLRVILNARLRLAEAADDSALTAKLAARQIIDASDGGVVASLAMRIASDAIREGRPELGLQALAQATERDPFCAPARTLKIDLLEQLAANQALAEEVEDLSNYFTSIEAQGRALLLASYFWAAGAGVPERARAALGQTSVCGIPNDTAARLGRSLASLCGDSEWYEASTIALLECKPASELLFLWVEVARLRLEAGDTLGAAKALGNLGELPDGSWLSHVFAAFPLGQDEDAETAKHRLRNSRAALEQLALHAPKAETRAMLTMMCALRAHAAGEADVALQHLRELHAGDARDPLVAAYLGDLLRAAGDHAGAANVAQDIADAHEDDSGLRAARLLEAGFEHWRSGNRTRAFAAFESAASVAAAGMSVLAWAARGEAPDTFENRQHAIALGPQGGFAILERFALQASMGDPEDAVEALGELDASSTASLRLAAVIARIVWPTGARDAHALARALDALAGCAEGTKAVAAAERLRITRVDESATTDDVIGAAQAWLDVGGGAAAAMEWLAAAMGSSNPTLELPARDALARELEHELREAIQAGAALLDAMLHPDQAIPAVVGSSPAVRLANLELSPPGSEPKKRARALAELGDALGTSAEIDALALAGWSALAAGDASRALMLFRTVTAVREDDLQSWEGIRAASEHLGDRETYATACEQLGRRCANHARGAAFWEQAALAWSTLGGAFDGRAEAALNAGFARDPSRFSLFDRLFRRVRERKEGAKLLVLAEERLQHTDDASEIAKLYWEMARVLREQGDPDAALEALDHVAMFDEHHIGALALKGEIFLRRGMFAEAAEQLARLALLEAAPAKNRITAGVAAIDIYENKLERHDRALEVLLALHAAKLSTLPVRERLALAAARTGSWEEATRILEELMHERPTRDARIEAARLAIAIYRERLGAPERALGAITKLLDEVPADGEALDLLLSLSAVGEERRQPLLERGRDALLMLLHETPADVAMQKRLARICNTQKDTNLEQSALSCVLALGGADAAAEQRLASLVRNQPHVPQIVLSEPMFRQIMATGDDGPIADLFCVLGPTLAEALGPQLATLGVHPKKDRVDPRAGISLRNEIASWAGAFGIPEFELYVGGTDPLGVQGIAGPVPAIVVGANVNAPLSPLIRARVARELLGIVRGTTITRWRDDTTIAAIVVAACNLAKVPVQHPPFAVLAEVERLLGRAISRKVKTAIIPICTAVAARPADAKQWAGRARASQSRVAVLASGDVSAALADALGQGAYHAEAARDDLRAHELLRFVLSRPYFDLRRALGLEGSP